MVRSFGIAAAMASILSACSLVLAGDIDSTTAGAPDASSGIAFVGAVTNTANATSVTTSVSTTAGDTIVVAVGVVETTANYPVSAITDDAGNAYSRRILGENASTFAEIWTSQPNTAAAKSLTVTMSGSEKFAIVIAEYSGVRGFGSSHETNGGAAVPPSSSLGTTVPKSWVVGATSTSSATSYTAGLGTLRGSTNTTGGGDVGLALIDAASASSGPTRLQVTAAVPAIWAVAMLEMTP
jgi:hypothetical protein